jgi:hypothetical protein
MTACIAAIERALRAPWGLAEHLDDPRQMVLVRNLAGLTIIEGSAIDGGGRRVVAIVSTCRSARGF